MKSILDSSGGTVPTRVLFAQFSHFVAEIKGFIAKGFLILREPSYFPCDLPKEAYGARREQIVSLPSKLHEATWKELMQEQDLTWPFKIHIP